MIMTIPNTKRSLTTIPIDGNREAAAGKLTEPAAVAAGKNGLTSPWDIDYKYVYTQAAEAVRMR
jgi:hypothetical protein